MKHIKWIQIAYYFTQMRMARCAWEYNKTYYGDSVYSSDNRRVNQITSNMRTIEAMDDMNSFYIKYCRAIQK